MSRSNALRTRPALLNAERVQRHRARRRRGEICVSNLVLDPWLVSGLVAGAWLARDRRLDSKAVAAALANFLNTTLDTRRFRRW